MGALLGLAREELLQAIRFVFADGSQYSGADALLAVAREVWWAHPLVWVSKLPGALPAMRKGYRWAAEHWRCHAQRCVTDQAPIGG